MMKAHIDSIRSRFLSEGLGCPASRSSVGRVSPRLAGLSEFSACTGFQHVRLDEPRAEPVGAR